jgi:hypothetical protein
MIHNIIEVDGVEYQAVAEKSDYRDACTGCVGADNRSLCGQLSVCDSAARVDCESVIYKRRISIKELQNAN